MNEAQLIIAMGLSWLVTLLAVIALICQLIRPRVSRRRLREKAMQRMVDQCRRAESLSGQLRPERILQKP